MSANIELSVEVENEAALRPAGHSDDPLFTAVWFKVTEQISQTYRLRVRVLAYSDDLALPSLIGRHMALTESRDLDDSGAPRSRVFKGVIWSAQQRGWLPGLDMYYYWLDVRPAVHALAMTSRSQVYGTDQARSIPEILDYCLTGGYGDTPTPLPPGIKGSIAYSTVYGNPGDYTSSTMLKDFLIQYNETDLNFMQRLMERWGIFYYFDPYQDQPLDTELAIIADDNNAFKFAGNAASIANAVTLDYVQASQYAPGTTYKVKSFVAGDSLRSQTLTLDDYNYRTASTDLSVQQNLDPTAGEGTRTLYAENFRSTGDGSDGQLLAQRMGDLAMAGQEFYTGESDCFELCAGFICALEGHFNSAYNTDKSASSLADMHGYLVTEVVHECSVPIPGEPWNGQDYGHAANFTAIECCDSYRPPRVTRVPRVRGVISATVDSADDTDRADLDDQGRYLARAKFDVSGLPDGQHSSRLRMMQPYGGTSAGGLMFPIAKGTEVLLTFVNGDLDRPIIVGAAPNSSNPSPVAQSSETRNRVVADSAITLELEDGDPTTSPLANWARLYLTQNGQKSYLRMGAPPTDEADQQLADIGGEALPSDAGLLDYTEGSRASGTAGDRSEAIGGNKREQVLGNRKDVVGGDYNLSVDGHHQVSVDGKHSLTAHGKAEHDFQAGVVESGAFRVTLQSWTIFDTAPLLSKTAVAENRLILAMNWMRCGIFLRKTKWGLKIAEVGATMKISALGIRDLNSEKIQYQQIWENMKSNNSIFKNATTQIEQNDILLKTTDNNISLKYKKQNISCIDDKIMTSDLHAFSE